MGQTDSDRGWPLTSCPWWPGTPPQVDSFDRAQLGVQQLSLGLSVFTGWGGASKPIPRPELALEAASLRSSHIYRASFPECFGTTRLGLLVVLEGSMSDVLGLAEGLYVGMGVVSMAGHPCGLCPNSQASPSGHHPSPAPCHALLTDTKPCTHPAGGNKSPRDCILLP